MYSGGLKHGGPFTSGIQGIRDNIPDLDHDDLYGSWLENDKETGAPDSRLHKTTRDTEEPSETLMFRGDEMGQDPVAANVNVRMGGKEDEIMVETDQFHESIAQVQEPGSSRGATDHESIDVSLGTQISSGIVSGSGASDHAGNVFASGQDVLVAKGNEFATTGMNTSATTSISEKITGDALELDGDDPFPEIFDVDPDSEDE
jgi:hypothetical protein